MGGGLARESFAYVSAALVFLSFVDGQSSGPELFDSPELFYSAPLCRQGRSTRAPLELVLSQQIRSLLEEEGGSPGLTHGGCTETWMLQRKLIFFTSCTGEKSLGKTGSPCF